MPVVYEVSTPGSLVTRLHLANTQWGNAVLARLAHQGYSVQATDQPPHPDMRDELELARRDAILEWASPD